MYNHYTIILVDHDEIDVILLRNQVYETDFDGTEALGKHGDVVTLPKDLGRALVSRCDALYATADNVSTIERRVRNLRV